MHLWLAVKMILSKVNICKIAQNCSFDQLNRFPVVLWEIWLNKKHQTEKYESHSFCRQWIQIITWAMLRLYSEPQQKHSELFVETICVEYTELNWRAVLMLNKNICHNYLIIPLILDIFVKRYILISYTSWA